VNLLQPISACIAREVLHEDSSSDFGTRACRHAFAGLSAQAWGEESPPVTLNGRSLVRSSPLSDMLYGRVAKVAVALSEQPTAQEDEGNWWERRSGTTKGAIIGAGVGAGVGLGFAVTLCGNEGGTNCNGQLQTLSTAIFGLIGTGIEAGIGALISR
jgi:hypothetical protein